MNFKTLTFTATVIGICVAGIANAASRPAPRDPSQRTGNYMNYGANRNDGPKSEYGGSASTGDRYTDYAREQERLRAEAERLDRQHAKIAREAKAAKDKARAGRQKEVKNDGKRASDKRKSRENSRKGAK